MNRPAVLLLALAALSLASKLLQLSTTSAHSGYAAVPGMADAAAGPAACAVGAPASRPAPRLALMRLATVRLSSCVLL
ncbi:Uncharacterised protein [Bordetella pertussis]|nr:Uncharacterised protein [Bordetella pertussis]